MQSAKRKEGETTVIYSWINRWDNSFPWEQDASLGYQHNSYWREIWQNSWKWIREQGKNAPPQNSKPWLGVGNEQQLQRRNTLKKRLKQKSW